MSTPTKSIPHPCRHDIPENSRFGGESSIWFSVLVFIRTPVDVPLAAVTGSVELMATDTMLPGVVDVVELIGWGFGGSIDGYRFCVTKGGSRGI